MSAFSIKIPEELHRALEARLRATGQTRSAFVRGLIERELAVGEDRAAALRHRVMALAGSVGGDEATTDLASDTNRHLRELGYGLDGARPHPR